VLAPMIEASKVLPRTAPEEKPSQTPLALRGEIGSGGPRLPRYTLGAS
jgi:hypothetical protein